MARVVDLVAVEDQEVLPGRLEVAGIGPGSGSPIRALWKMRLPMSWLRWPRFWVGVVDGHANPEMLGVMDGAVLDVESIAPVRLRLT